MLKKERYCVRVNFSEIEVLILCLRDEIFIFIFTAGDIGYLSEKVRCSEVIVFRHSPATYDYSWHNAPRRPVLLSATLSNIIYSLVLNSSFCILHLSPSLCPVFPQVRQFIVNLDGDVEVEVSSGEKRVITRGKVFFVEDITG